MARQMITVMCECGSPSCIEPVRLPLYDWMDILEAGNRYVISDKCEHGPEATDTLAEHRQGYALYVAQTEKV